jgi:hypothetical protein
MIKCLVSKYEINWAECVKSVQGGGIRGFFKVFHSCDRFPL